MIVGKVEQQGILDMNYLELDPFGSVNLEDLAEKLEGKWYLVRELCWVGIGSSEWQPFGHFELLEKILTSLSNLERISLAKLTLFAEGKLTKFVEFLNTKLHLKRFELELNDSNKNNHERFLTMLSENIKVDELFVKIKTMVVKSTKLLDLVSKNPFLKTFHLEIFFTDLPTNELISQVFGVIGESNNLETFDLTVHSFGQLLTMPKYLTYSIQKTSSLRELKICGFNFCNSFLNLSEPIKNNKTINKLDFRYNLLGRDDGEAVSLILSGNSNITDLKLNNNFLGAATSHIFQSLKTNYSLQSLDLSDNLIGKEIGKKIGEMLIANKVLKNLDLSNNPMNEGLLFIFDALSENTCLEFLSCSNSMEENQEQIETLSKSISNVLEKNSNLTSLNFANHHFNYEQVDSILKALSEEQA